jgi:hypothetical protein
MRRYAKQDRSRAAARLDHCLTKVFCVYRARYMVNELLKEVMHDCV